MLLLLTVHNHINAGSTLRPGIFGGILCRQ